ncbi:MAG: Asp-tRNA(Asn)/Glu-tRNA(Gln) amidotransferase subunit GatB [Anaerolineaceae bacterium]|nr:MAG: Asp-tRNA(Asn)/Glu-tRNA(Gln) amidotransferase subunit GatB [Anaerolineaceae bacterium]
MSEFEVVIGLETHIQLNTQSKIFCGCKADSWGDPPNTNICPVCTGLPGVLPVLNRSVVEKAVLLAAAMHAVSIQPISYFARKNYFYPDLPKGYQISQYDEPLARGGKLDLPMPDGSSRLVTITKLHIEEDAGKTVYQNGKRLIDFNRCGVPLVEMVTGPDLRSADEAAQYLIRLRQLLRWLGISEGDMEKGQLRCDANVSIRPIGAEKLSTKTEIKNLNSIENVRTAIQAEVERQIREVDSGKTIGAWTLTWDEDSGTLAKMRTKETEADYRYFREPDLLPIRLDEKWCEEILAHLPELPLERRARFVDQYALPLYDAEILTDERSLSDYFEQAVSFYDGEAKVVSNWLMNDVLRMIRERGVRAESLRLRPKHLAEIIHMVEEKVITTSTGKAMLEKVEESGRNPSEIVEEEGLAQVSDDETLRSLASEILSANPEQVTTYKDGKTTIIGWFVGQVMQKTQGKANPQMVKAIFEELLSKDD